LSLQSRIVEALTARNLTLSTAESCTGGGLSQRLTDVPGASACFVGGVIAYQNRVKSAMLDVPQETLVTYGAVSAETAEAMARGCRARFATDWAISITGIAGPTGGSPQKPIGLVFMALADARATRVVEHHFTGARDEVRSQAVDAALAMILGAVSQ
jgi:PncC family amidohydrolase